MKNLAFLLARFLETLRVGHANPAALFTLETAEALAEFYGDGPIPAAEIHLVEALFFDRYLTHQLETHLGERGLFVKKGDDPHGALHPAVNAAIRARGRYAKLMRDLAKQRGTGRGTDVPPVEQGHDVPATAAPTNGKGTSPERHGQDAHATAPNGHAVAPSPGVDSPEPPTPAFMNRAMRRRALKEAKAAHSRS